MKYLTQEDLENFIEETGCTPGCECGECFWSSGDQQAWRNFLQLVSEGKATDQDWPAFG